MHDGAELQQYLKNFIKEITGNENTTFAQWHALKESNPALNLKDIAVAACNISRGVDEIFSYSNPRLKDTPIWQAIAASGAFPGYFKPVKITLNNQVEEFSDGGLQNNCPINFFDNPKGTPNPEAIGLWLATTSEVLYLENGDLPPIQDLNHTYEDWEAEVAAQIEGSNYDVYTGPYQKQMIFVNSLGISTLDFNLSEEQKAMLMLSGVISVFLYMAQHYPEFAREHYSLQIFQDLDLTQENLDKLKFPKETYENLLKHLNALPKHDPASESVKVLTPHFDKTSVRDSSGNANSPPPSFDNTNAKSYRCLLQ